MSLEDDVRTLVDFGVFSEEGVSKLAGVIRAVQSLGFAQTPGGSAGAPVARRRGRPPAASQGAAGTTDGTPRKRGKLTASDAELKAMYIDQGMTSKAIGEKYGVSGGAVAVRVSKLGLSKRGKSEGKGEKKEKGKK